MPLINCETFVQITWSEKCIITNSTGAGTFAITYTKLYVLVVTLSTQANTKLLEQIKLGFKRVINWNKYQSKVSTQTQNQYLYYFIDPSFKESTDSLLYHFRITQSEEDTQDIFF